MQMSFARLRDSTVSGEVEGSLGWAQFSLKAQQGWWLLPLRLIGKRSLGNPAGIFFSSWSEKNILTQFGLEVWFLFYSAVDMPLNIYILFPIHDTVVEMRRSSSAPFLLELPFFFFYEVYSEYLIIAKMKWICKNAWKLCSIYKLFPSFQMKSLRWVFPCLGFCHLL